MIKKAIGILTVTTMMVFAAEIPAARAEAPVDIVTHITAGRIHTVTLPDSLIRLLSPAALPAEAEPTDSDSEETTHLQQPSQGRMAGFRVQVFSDNNPKTAKNEARSKQRAIASRFPQYRAYVSFNSPYWRLKVGDFRTQQEAQEAAEELKQAFPASGKEIRVVRDRINLSN
ncbi:MAG: SPOR domain-containing protein [Clostridium sp.]|nr:SPOR domain-containing protein [Clostridium sp.]